MWYRGFLWLTAVAALSSLAFGRSQAADEAIAYDQVERVLAPDVPAPAPENFASDEDDTRAQIMHEEGGRRGIGRLLPVIGRRAPRTDALTALADDLRALGYPRIERHVFYHGWERVENLVTGTVVLHKCDVGSLITIDPEHKTYRLDDPVELDRARLLQIASREQPGKAILDLVRHADPAPAQTADAAAAARPFTTQETLNITNASGSCRAAAIAATTQTYFAAFDAPRSMCPQPAPDFPSTPLAVVARDGCRPVVQAHADGPAPPAGELVLYRLLDLTEGNDRLRLLTARGNVHPVADPAPLFEVPSGYTKAP